MNRIILIVWIAASSWAFAQDLGRPMPPSGEALWEVLGSASTVEIVVRSPDVKSVLFVTMYRGEVLVSQSEDVDAEDNPVLTITAGALKPGVGAQSCALAFLHHREVRDHGGGSGLSQRCLDVEGVVNLTRRSGPGPLNVPYWVAGEDPTPLPTGRWLLFGATDVFTEDSGAPAGDPASALAHYVLLSTEQVSPLAEAWELPAYETWRDAYDAFEAP